jgi:hypothetical protein
MSVFMRFLCGAYEKLESWIWRMRNLGGVAKTWWDAVGDFSLSRTPTHSPPDVKTGRGTPRSLYTPPPFGRVLVMLVAGILAQCANAFLTRH